MGKAAAWLPVVLLIAFVVWFGGKLSSSEPAAQQPVNLASTTTSESADAGGKKAKRPHSHALAEQHDAGDQTIALNATLQPQDVQNGVWHSTTPPKKAAPCPRNDPDLSSLTLTAMADTAYTNADTTGWTESIVRLFPDKAQAGRYFEAVNNPRELACTRDAFRSFLKHAKAHPRLAYSRLQKHPSLGDRTAVYLIGFALTYPSGAKDGYPVELLRFQRGRAVVSLTYVGVYSPDGSRPCTCELDHARVVYERLAAA